MAADWAARHNAFSRALMKHPRWCPECGGTGKTNVEYDPDQGQQHDWCERLLDDWAMEDKKAGITP